jgi:hypothetical protein
MKVSIVMLDAHDYVIRSRLRLDLEAAAKAGVKMWSP